MKRPRRAFVAVAIALSSFVLSCGPKPPAVEEPGGAAPGPQLTSEGVQFVFLSQKAHRVMIAGDFNNWSTTADPMYDRDGKGAWTITLPLKPGRYEYKFFVDGEKWVPDAENPKRVKDGFGAYNSVIEVKP
jgi:1,4-alpha-glucan branching enzyme